MSIFDDTRVSVFVADFANVDQQLKLNVIGGVFTVLGVDPSTRLTPPHSVVMIMDAPSEHASGQFALQLQLRNETTGEPVTFVNPAGEAEVVQMATMQRFPPNPAHFGAPIPEDFPLRLTTVVGMTGGVGVEQGNQYAWTVSIDGQTKPGWAAHFFVPGPPVGPVVGGPPGPADITGLLRPGAPPTDEPPTQA